MKFTWTLFNELGGEIKSNSGYSAAKVGDELMEVLNYAKEKGQRVRVTMRDEKGAVMADYNTFEDEQKA